MNPIKFAKMNKQRKSACEDVIKNINHIPVEELKKQLNTYGMSDKGTQYVLKNRVVELFKHQLNIIGFGEISRFGDKMIRDIFRRFDADEDGALSLWELNAWLFHLGANTLGNKKDYLSLIEDLGLQTKKAKLRKGESESSVHEKDEYVTTNGIVAYYERYGRLERDIKSLGIGSLNTILSGTMRLNCEYDHDAISSLLNLFEPHTLFFAQVKKVITFFVSMRGFDLSGDYKEIGSIPFIRDIEWLTDLLKEPGFFASALNEFGEWLADADDGFIRSLRLSALEKFGKYSNFDKIIEGFAEIKDTATDASPDVVAHQNRDMRERVNDVLPRNVDSFNIASQLDILFKRNEELLSSISGSTIMLSRHEREGLKVELKSVDAEIRSLRERQETAMQYFVAHFTAFYDSIRNLTKCPVTLGWGTREMGLRVNITGLTWKYVLPRAKGEACVSKKAQLDKIDRAMKRKKAALQAIRRENARRNMTDEEREALRIAKEEKLRAETEQQWQQYFRTAYGALLEAREEQKNTNEVDHQTTNMYATLFSVYEDSTYHDLFEATHSAPMSHLIIIILSQIHEMEEKWETLLEFTEFKYPNTLKCAVTLSNYAVLLYDFVIKRDTRKKERVLTSLKTSSNIVSKMVAPYVQEHREEKGGGGAEITYSLTDIDKDQEQIATYVVLLHNYIIYLRNAVNDVAALQRSSEMMIQITLLNEVLSDKERSNLASERTVAGMHIIPIMKDIFAAEFVITLQNSERHLVKKVCYVSMLMSTPVFMYISKNIHWTISLSY